MVQISTCWSLACVVVFVAVASSVSGSYLENGTLYEEENSYNSDIGYSPSARSYRKSKFFPLFTIIRFTNEVCRTSNEEGGVCYTRKQCTLLGGTTHGSCAQGLGVCCQFQATCGAIITQNGTMFRNPNYPQKYSPTGGSDVCQVRIRKPPNVCQVRLNFHKFDIDGPVPGTSGGQGAAAPSPDAGACKTDALSITSSGALVPQLCGQLAGQHIYMDFGTSDSVTLNLLLSGNAIRDREWSIEVVTIPCNSLSRAPVGCLQYFTGVSGQVESFNFPGAVHLANQDYSVCVRMEDGMRSIEWSTCTPGSVKISGPATATNPTPTTPPAACPAAAMLTDYLIIMGGIQYPLATTGTTAPAPMSINDRFCDSSFALPSYVVRSTVRPFILHFKTDATETATDTSNGFCLKWQQNPNT